MSTLVDFETTLKEVVNAKRLSASRMSKLTEIAMKTLQDDTRLVATLYCTHKSLHSSSKVSSLYAFDALARAARNMVIKHGMTGDINSQKGNAATFLLKIEGVLDGLFQDMITIDNPEAKEKTKKVLDIWIKSNTFPSTVLTRLRDILTDVPKESPANPNVQVFVQAPETSTTPPLPLPPTMTSPNPSVQLTLLSLLGQAAQATAPSQTPPNHASAPQLEQAQLALLQQLTAKLGNGAPLQTATPVAPSSLSSVGQGRGLATSTPSTSHPSSRAPPGAYPRPEPSHGDPRYGGTGYPERLKDRTEPADERPSHRGGHRGGYRGRRGGWEDRGHDRFKQKGGDWYPPTRPRNSRSRSPRRPEGRDLRPHSPPRRPLSGKDHYQTELASSGIPESGKDEFGRDLRPSSVTPPRSPSTDDTPAPGPKVPSVVPASAAAADCRIPVPDQLPVVAANTPAQNAETHNSSSATSEPPGLDQFDITTFDATTPSSWEGLGNKWKTTYGYLPSQEELMQFVLTGGMALTTAAGGPHDNSQSGQWQQDGRFNSGSRGTGGRRSRGRGGYMNSGREGHLGDGDGNHWGYTDAGESQHSDAVVLGAGDEQDVATGEHPDGHTEPKPTGEHDYGAGRMQRVGDKWVFVRDSAS